MTVPFRHPQHWAEVAQADEPHVEKMRGWPLLGVYAGVLGFCIAVWWGVGQAIAFLARGLG